MASKPSATKVLTGKCRLSYVHLFEPYAQNEGQDKKYSCVLWIPKSDTVTLGKIDRAIKAAAEAGKSSKFNGKIPANLQTTLHDCDEDDDLDEQPEKAGHYRMSVSSKTAPGIVDRQVQPIIDSTEVYSGCYARAEINAFAYNTNGNKGVSFGLNHIQKLADGDFLGGRSRAEDAFDPIPDEEDDEAASLI
jgi:hypothetical protein